MKKLALLIVLFAFAALGAAPPDRPDPTPEMNAPAVIPQISGSSVYGYIAQNGRTFTITGGFPWFGEGEVRADGSLFVRWFDLCSEHKGRGVYRIGTNGSIQGAWGYDDEVSLDADGMLQGFVDPDVMRFGNEPEPDL